MAHNWKVIVKHGALTAGEAAAIGTGMILTKKFLDARVLFEKQIAADPTYAEKWYIKHQGAVKIAIGVTAAALIKNPWIKMFAIGLAVEGFITEARVLTTNKDGVAFFDSIGNSDQSQIDQEMIEAAKQTQGGNFGDRFATHVGQIGATFGDRFATSVGWGFNPMEPNPQYNGVSGGGWVRG